MAYTAFIQPRQPVTPLLVLGNGVMNLGVVLIIAGIFAGTFRAFGLHHQGRYRVLLAGVTAVLLGGWLASLGSHP